MAKILIVEDDKRTNMAICEYLKPTGHNIVSAYDGEEALQLFHSTTIDLIVLDIMLPRLTGIAVLHEIRKSSLIPVLMLTADRKSTRLNSSHNNQSRMPSSA